MKKSELQQLIKEEIIKTLKKSILEVKYKDVAVWPAKGAPRGTTQADARAFDIYIGDPDIIRKMAKTPMGKPGKMTSFSYDGPGSANKDYEWDADTSQWDVWKNMNYMSLTSDNHVHWYHGKAPGGYFRDKNNKLLPGATGTPLPALTIKGFGVMVYKAVLLDPTVGYILSDNTSTGEIRKHVYGPLMNDKDFIWISAGGTGGLDYDEIVVINPKYADEQKIKQQFEEKHKGNKFFYSRNFPK